MRQPEPNLLGGVIGEVQCRRRGCHPRRPSCPKVCLLISADRSPALTESQTLPIRLSPTAASGSVRPCSSTCARVAIFGSHDRSQSSSDFFPTTRPTPPTWRRLAGATGLFAHCQAAGEPFRFANRPGVLRCRKCRRDTGLTVETVMARSHTPLSVWFWSAIWRPAKHPACRPCSFGDELACRATRRRSKSSASSAPGWCARIRTGSAAGPASTSKSMKPGLAAGRAAKAVASTIRFLSPALWRFASASRDQARQAEGWSLCRAGSARRRAGPQRGVALRLRGVRRCAGHVAGHRRPERLRQPCQARLQTPRHRNGAIRRSPTTPPPQEYLPIIHLVFANLKTWLNGIHHGVSHRRLQAYLNEFTFRFNRRFYKFNAFRSLLGIAGDVTAPTYAELYSGAWQHRTSSGVWVTTG